MIINSYDLSEPVIKVEKIYKKEQFYSDICIVSFSRKIKEQVIEQFAMQKVTDFSYASFSDDVYVFEHNGKLFHYYLSPITGALSATVLYEIAYKLSIKKFIVFGSCGCLDENAFGKLIVPTESYRDEGLSYHYMAPSDYIEIKNADKLASIFDELNVTYAKGRNWSTDAIYMETANKVNARKNEGCISVEMEASSLQAICNYAGVQLYTFFFTSDIVKEENWDNRHLGLDSEKKEQKTTFDVALEVALRI